MTAAPAWNDDTADLLAMVALAREDGAWEASREAFGVIAAHCDRDGVLASAVKLLAELAADLGLCNGCLREYAARAIAR